MLLLLTITRLRSIISSSINLADVFFISRWENQERRFKKNTENGKKPEGETYLAKERARQKKNYIKVEDLKSDDAKKRREKTRERERKHRQAKKEMAKNGLIVAVDFRKKRQEKSALSNF